MHLDLSSFISWFLKHKRSFSFREKKTPYRVWVAEVMLQQTRASVVEEYFKRWIEIFPDVFALAKADLALVIKTWEGLGYYSRARNLHLGAKQIVEFYNGVFPSDKESLLKIKGIGDYTVGAILSFAFHQKCPAVDGNVLRVVSRLLELDSDISKPSTKKQVTEYVEKILPEANAHLVMEGLIELGATLCGKNPKCFVCPLKRGCKAYLNDSQNKYPIKLKKEKTIFLERRVFVIEAEDCVLLKKEKDEKKIMSALYEFPYFEKGENQEACAFLEEIKASFVKNLGFQSHTFTKYKARLCPEKWKASFCKEILGYEWVKKSSLDSLPYSSGHKKVLEEYLLES